MSDVLHWMTRSCRALCGARSEIGQNITLTNDYAAVDCPECLAAKKRASVVDRLEQAVE